MLLSEQRFELSCFKTTLLELFLEPFFAAKVVQESYSGLVGIHEFSVRVGPSNPPTPSAWTIACLTLGCPRKLVSG